MNMMVSLMWLIMWYLNQMVQATSTPQHLIDPKDLAAALINNKMSGNVLQNLDQDVNMAFSGYSLGNAMGMLLLGARGKTKEQITSKFFGAKDVEEVGASYKRIDASVEKVIKSETVTINSVNKVYVATGFKLTEEYLKTVKKYYAGEPKSIDFTNKEKAATEINSFVAENTNDMIKDLLKKDLIKEDTKIILVNALYFKGSWVKPFDDAVTENFHIGEKKKVEAEMMWGNGQFQLVALDKSAKVLTNTKPVDWIPDKGQTKSPGDATVLRIPYKGDKMDMVLVVPKKSKDLGHFEKKIYENDKIFSMDACNCGDMVDARISIPKFKVETSLDKLKENLAKMGVGEMFDEQKADFTGISEHKTKLVVSEVIQKVVFKVAEKGSEAAAATAVIVPIPISRPIDQKPKPIVRVNKPFLYFIVERATGGILFSGRMVDPSEAKYDD